MLLYVILFYLIPCECLKPSNFLHSNITGNCSSNVSATTDSDNKAASGEGEVPATAASEAEDFAHLAEQFQLDQISKDGNGTETFQVGFSK